MANLIETSTFPAGVYRLERTDPVDAGVGGSGISNLQATQLAARTRYLKDVLDAVGLDLTNASLRVPSFAIASLPPAVPNARKVFYATNANAGAGSLVISDGAIWIDVRTGLLVTTTATSITTGATTSTSGTVILATSGESITGTDPNKAITAFTLQAKINAIPSLGAATTTTSGTVILATSGESITGTDPNKAITAFTLQAKINTVASPPATESVPGNIQIATQVETRGLTVLNKAITPNSLAGILPSIAAAGGQFARVNNAGTAFSYTLENTTQLITVVGGTFVALANRYHFFSSACTVTLPIAPPEGTFIAFFNSQGSGTITISATGTNAHNATLAANLRGYLIFSSGNWRNVGFSAGAFVASGSAVFAYTGSNQNWLVPAAVTTATALIWAGGGGGGPVGGGGGGGGAGFVQATFTTTPGETLTMLVGQGGQHWGTAQTGNSASAFGGGGRANQRGTGTSFFGAGGGRSGILRAAVELLTAGAGGGGGYGGFGAGGFGGGSSGGVGSSASDGGGGGTQSVGGAASNLYGGSATAGSLYAGGNASTTGTLFAADGGCGGGSGFYGGGGTDSNAGGGGSSFTGAGTTAASTIAGSGPVAANNTHPSYAAGVGNGGAGGANGGNGRIVIVWG